MLQKPQHIPEGEVLEVLSPELLGSGLLGSNTEHTGKDTPASESRQPSLMGSGNLHWTGPRGCRYTLHCRSTTQTRHKLSVQEMTGRRNDRILAMPDTRVPARKASTCTRFLTLRTVGTTELPCWGCSDMVGKLQVGRKGGSHFLACRDILSLHLFICVPQAPCPTLHSVKSQR